MLPFRQICKLSQSDNESSVVVHFCIFVSVHTVVVGPNPKMSSEEGGEGPSTPKKVRQARGELTKSEKSWRIQAFSDKWLEDKEFQGWLSPHESDKFKAKCKCCDKVLKAGRSELLKHKNTATHRKNEIKLKGMTKLTNIFTTVKSDKATTAEIRLALLAVEHNFSFNSMEHTVKLCQTIFPDSKIASDIKMQRTKITNVVKNVLSKSVQSETSEQLQSKLFSILVDESTDISAEKNLCILARYINDGDINVSLLSIIKVGAEGATSDSLYELLEMCLRDHGLSVDQIIGYCSDNASVMIGKKHSLAVNILKNNSETIILSCICHTAHLIASAACDELPKNVESLLHLIFNYFSRSPKRQAILEELQEYMRADKHRMISPSRTRWLALCHCVDRILKQWPVLWNLFSKATLEDKTTVAEIIFNDLDNSFTKAYLQFLNFVLPDFNSFNAIFQSDKVLITVLASECERFLRLIGSKFLKPAEIQSEKIFTCNPKLPSNFLPIEDIKLGGETESTLTEISKNVKYRNSDILTFRTRCLRFYQVAFQEALNRFTKRDHAMCSEFKLFEPSVALNTPRSVPKILIERFKSKFNEAKLLDEWENLPHYFSESEKTELLKLSTVKFWDSIFQCKNYNDIKLFENIGTLANIVLCLPHSNAAVERIFSIVTDIKTKKRNRIATDTLDALVRVKLEMKKQGKHCFDFKIPKDMYTLFNSHNIYKYSQVQQLQQQLYLLHMWTSVMRRCRRIPNR